MGFNSAFKGLNTLRYFDIFRTHPWKRRRNAATDVHFQL